MKQRIVTGIDVGTSLIKVIVLGYPIDGDVDGASIQPNILGIGYSESRGLREGYIINQSDAIRSIRNAFSQAEKASGVRITDAYVAISGVGLTTFRAHGETIASRPDQEISDTDIDKAEIYSEETLRDELINYTQLHVIPLSYKLDGKIIHGHPQGLYGTKLEVESFFIASYEQHLRDLTHAIEYAGVRVNDSIAGPLATSLVTTTKVHKRAGCILVDIGAETTSIMVFENSTPTAMHVFSVGSVDITNDIALNFKISLEEAEKMKRSGPQSTAHPKKRFDEVVSKRYTDIFTRIKQYLIEEKITTLLPAGVLLTGGGTVSPLAIATAREILDLPVQACQPPFGKEAKIRDPIWATAYGVCKWGSNNAGTDVGEVARKASISISHWFKQFLP